MKSRTVSVKSADRVLDLLELLTRRGKAMSHTELSLALRIPKSSLTQLLRNLTERGYLVFSPGPNTYEPGPGFFALLRQGHEGFNLSALARPVLEKLTGATHESSSFNVYRKDYVALCGIDSPQALTYRMTVGTRFLLYSSSAGKRCSPRFGKRARTLLAKVRLAAHRGDRQVGGTAPATGPDSRRRRWSGANTCGDCRGRRGSAASGRLPGRRAERGGPAIRFDAALDALCLRELKRQRPRWNASCARSARRNEPESRLTGRVRWFSL
jgi:DNA-binding IclR family transcriptional regulator